jgi:hypothetical protein
LEDKGKICQIGYSAGARSKCEFNWVKNVVGKISAEKLRSLDHKSSSAFALFWNMLRSHVPRAIIEDISDFCDPLGIYRMDGGAGLSTTTGNYTVEIEGLPVVYHDVELAPPCGIVAANYARAIHYEHQPHKYAMAWTTCRSGEDEDGGHFFVSKYGIRVHSAPNTLVIWQPRMPHGTSLQNLSPDDPTPAFSQTGMSIVTSNRIHAAWTKYVAAGLEGVPEECIPQEVMDMGWLQY